MTDGPGTILINGAVGVGKTTTADELADQWQRAGRPGAMIDLDAIRYAWPQPADDGFNHRLTITNLTSLAANLRAAGHDHLILAGVVETRAERDAYAAAVGGTLTLVRLTGSWPLIEARIRARHGDDHESRDWHLRRHPELQAILDAAALDDHVISIDGRTPAELAAAITALVDGDSAPPR